jgi:hypothetical protein
MEQEQLMKWKCSACQHQTKLSKGVKTCSFCCQMMNHIPQTTPIFVKNSDVFQPSTPITTKQFLLQHPQGSNSFKDLHNFIFWSSKKN